MPSMLPVMTNSNIILATASTARAALFKSIGLDPICMPARIDEAAVKSSMLADDAPHRDIADTLAETKAAKIALRYPTDIVIGADQVLSAQGRLFDKAKDLAELRDQLTFLRGKTHQLISAVVAYEENKPVWRHIGIVRLTMRDFSDGFLETYLSESGSGLLDTVGGYKIEENGAALFNHIEGDYFSILGIPFLEVLAFLRTRGLVST